MLILNETAEDFAQRDHPEQSDAFTAALQAWPAQGVPANPEGWLLTAARNIRKNIARGSAVRRQAEPEILRRIEEAADRPMPSGRSIKPSGTEGCTGDQWAWNAK